MPPLGHLRCDKCKFEINRGIHRRMYVVLPGGEWEYLGHPGEFRHYMEITGKRLDYDKALEEGEIGFADQCICLDCFEEFDVDRNEERRVCEHCGSEDVWATSELVDEHCPLCEQGFLRFITWGWS